MPDEASEVGGGSHVLMKPEKMLMLQEKRLLCENARQTLEADCYVQFNKTVRFHLDNARDRISALSAIMVGCLVEVVCIQYYPHCG